MDGWMGRRTGDSPERVSARRGGGGHTDSSFFILFLFYVFGFNSESRFGLLPLRETGREGGVRVRACRSRGRPPPLIGWP